MKKLLRKLENIYAAVAFAEVGKSETAREILREEERQKPRKEDRISPIKREGGTTDEGWKADI